MAERQPCHERESHVHNIRSTCVKRRRGRRDRCTTASWCRSARISRCSETRERTMNRREWSSEKTEATKRGYRRTSVTSIDATRTALSTAAVESVKPDQMSLVRHERVLGIAALVLREPPLHRRAEVLFARNTVVAESVDPRPRPRRVLVLSLHGHPHQCRALDREGRRTRNAPNARAGRRL
jgi:hypothetical protein